jgi:hypothetical protein
VSSFLTAEERRELTGHARAAAQIRWLKSRRIRHFINAAGQPVVRWEWLDGEKPEAGPRFELLPGQAVG